MKNLNTSWRIALGATLAVVAAVALAFAASAVGGGNDHTVAVGKLKRQVATLKTQVTASRSELTFLKVSSRLPFIEGAGIHGMETKYFTTGLTDRDIGTLQNILNVVKNLSWPGALKADAAELVNVCQDFLDTWRAGDKAAALDKLKATHGAYHALVVSGYAWLATQSY